MIEIIPAVLPKDFADLAEKTALVAGHAPYVHIDVLDGFPAPHDGGLPHWEDMNFEAHLMVADPELAYEDWVRAGVERLIVHVGSGKFENILKMRGKLDLEVGLALEFGAPVEALLPHILDCDFVHLMSIRNLGQQGEPFEEGIFDTIQQVLDAHPDAVIAVDGGVNTKNAERLIKAGVKRLVVGSAIFSADDPIRALEDLQSLAE